MSEEHDIGMISGVILAGGLATRMGGGDKGLLEAGGLSLLGRVIGRISPQVARLALNANGDPARFAAFDLPVLRDDIDGFHGPLAGILTGMTWAAKLGSGYVLTVPADVPLLPMDLVVRLSEVAAEADSDLPILAASDTGLHPVIGFWPVSLAGDVAAALTRGDRAVHRFAEASNAIAVPFPLCEISGRTIDPFFNVNTPDDLATLKALLEE